MKKDQKILKRRKNVLFPNQVKTWRSKMFCMPVYLSSVYEGDIITRVAWLALYVPDSYDCSQLILFY